jgi:HK97 family phage prohead protease
MQIEKRKCELRVDNISEPGKVFLVGRATPFNTRTELAPGYYEQSVTGAADEALPVSKISHLVNHDNSRFLGDTVAGTTRVWADSSAIRYKTELATETQEAKTLMVHYNRGEVRGASFAFSVDPDPGAGAEKFEKIIDDDGQPAVLRTIYKFYRIYDVSTLIGAEPAYPGTTATLSDRALPPTMPAEYRALLEQRAAPKPDLSDVDTDDDAPPECQCLCDRCMVEGRCEECEGEEGDCDDEACRAAGCPMQDRTHPDDDDDDDIQDLLDELEGDRSAPEIEDELAMIDLGLQEALLGL